MHKVPTTTPSYQPNGSLMGAITVTKQHLNRLLADSTHAHQPSYQSTFNRLAQSHLGRAAADIVPMLRVAAEEGQLAFTADDLLAQAEAISAGTPYALRITVI